jgi:hypothetical protein
MKISKRGKYFFMDRIGLQLLCRKIAPFYKNWCGRISGLFIARSSASREWRY